MTDPLKTWKDEVMRLAEEWADEPQFPESRDALRTHLDTLPSPPAQAPEGCPTDKDPRGCWNVRCQLGKRCINPATPPAPGAQEPAAQWEDSRVQAVYEILCADEVPPPEQHWEGFAARRIVDALFPANPPAIPDSSPPSADSKDAEPTREQLHAWWGVKPKEAELREKLLDPLTVHVSMLRGQIAAPDLNTMLHVYGQRAQDDYEALQKDAERYRWLRENRAQFLAFACSANLPDNDIDWPAWLDAAIDAAMNPQEPK